MIFWNVFLNDEIIDSVPYNGDCSQSYVRRGLINHDGYDPEIKVFPSGIINQSLARKLSLLDEWDDVEPRENELNGKKIAYHTGTEFLVQVGKDRGSYKTRHIFIGNLTQAVLYYNAINIGRGYKKRLLMPSANKPLLARQFS